MARSGGTARRPRPPGILYTGLTMAMLAVLATLTITASQTPPPAIAEFAPEAVEQIKEAPLEQTSQVGEAAGLATGSTTTTTTTTVPGAEPGATTTTRPAVERPRVRRCIGNPPRQTEDPQSPPCVPFWEGDNGGATYKGVTGDSIKVWASQLSERQLRALERYFNKRYELYDRQLELTREDDTEDDGTCPTKAAGATYVDEVLQVFASLESGGNHLNCLYEALARRKIPVALGQTTYSEEEMARFRPYLWQYPAANDKIMRGVGEMTCARLAGRSAEHSPDPLTQAKERHFGVILQYNRDESTISIDPLRQELAKCGTTVEAFYDYGRRLSPATDNDAILKMKADDVTSVICICQVFLSQGLGPAATAQQYFPEWIVSTYGGLDLTLGIKGFWPDARQREALFGATFLPRQRNLEEEPAWWAVREADPTFPVSETVNLVQYYHALMLLVSGIQMAGPNLTPETIEAALHRTEFPNPPHPGNFGKVGFTTGDHSMTEDAAEYFWNEAQPSPRSTATSGDGSPGALCYVELGARRELGAWPRGGDVFFNPRPPAPCFSGA